MIHSLYSLFKRKRLKPAMIRPGIPCTGNGAPVEVGYYIRGWHDAEPSGVWAANGTVRGTTMRQSGAPKINIAPRHNNLRLRSVSPSREKRDDGQ